MDVCQSHYYFISLCILYQSLISITYFFVNSALLIEPFNNYSLHTTANALLLFLCMLLSPPYHGTPTNSAPPFDHLFRGGRSHPFHTPYTKSPPPQLLAGSIALLMRIKISRYLLQSELYCLRSANGHGSVPSGGICSCDEQGTNNNIYVGTTLLFN